MTIKDLVSGSRRKTALTKREEDVPFFSLQRRVNDLFDSFFSDFGSAGEEIGPWGGGRQFMPTIDVKESDQAIEVTAELPGMDEKDLDVSLTKDALVLKGEKREEKEEKGKDYWQTERRYGSFHRVIPLPEYIDTEKVEATFKKGVLHITIYKTEGAAEAGKKIAIKTE